MDTSETLYAELKELEIKIESAGQNVHFSGAKAAEARANYEDKKNKMLIQMFADEAGDKSLKPKDCDIPLHLRTGTLGVAVGRERMESLERLLKGALGQSDQRGSPLEDHRVGYAIRRTQCERGMTSPAAV
jgi:hypothetical protein